MIHINAPIAAILATAFGLIMALYAIKTHFNIKKAKKKEKQAVRNHQRLLSQKKSSEIRVGKIGENMAPFLKDWPYDPNKFRFLGNPVDGIQFTDDEIIFVEIKTGKSKLTKTQRSLRNLLRKDCAVSFATFRIGENGCTLKRDLEDDDDEDLV